MLHGLLDPKVDFVFKNIFGSENHPDILISFLNATLKPKHLIKKVRVTNTDLEKKFIEDKFSRLDIKATTDNDEIINIEIQLNKDELIKISNNSEQRKLYEFRAKMLKDEVSALNKARKEGVEEGIEQGIERGIEKGKIEVARNLLKGGADINLIATATGLNIEVIEKLKFK